jgi:hypothetical protein
LFPLATKDLDFRDEIENSLCPSFMKSISISRSHSCIDLRNLRTSNLAEEEKKEDKEQMREEDEVYVEKVKRVKKLNGHKKKAQKKEEPEEIKSISKEKKNKKFTKEEDEKLKALVKTHGEGAWSRIANEMEDRNRKQVRERYVNFLKKERVVAEFTQEEDNIIVQHVIEQGRKWCAIAEILSGKTPIMIKNRYYAKLHKFVQVGAKQGNESDSRADAYILDQATLSGSKTNRLSTQESEESLENLQLQEENLKCALAMIQKKIEEVKTKGKSKAY